MWYIHPGFFGLVLGSFLLMFSLCFLGVFLVWGWDREFRMGNKENSFCMNTCRKNWTSFPGPKSEGGAVAKIQCKTGIKTQM